MRWLFAVVIRVRHHSHRFSGKEFSRVPGIGRSRRDGVAFTVGVSEEAEECGDGESFHCGLLD